MKNYLTEFLGTFFLVLTIGFTILPDTPFAPLAIGSVLMALVYMGWHVSGAHYNPAISLAVYLCGKIEARELIPYMFSQIVGALLASVVVYLCFNETFALTPRVDASLITVVSLELLFTLLLTVVILNTAMAKKTAGNSYYGLAIGFTVMAGAFAAGPISGGVFNPAVGIGPLAVSALFGGGSLASLWIYLVGPFAGAIAGTFIFKMQNPEG